MIVTWNVVFFGYMIVLSNVSKAYGDFAALHETNVTFGVGQTSVIIGPSGCGKSTVLRLINGLIAPSSGSVTIQDQLLNAHSVLQIRQRMGYVIQDGGLFPHFTARENIILLAVHLKLPKAQIDRRVRELCSITQFEHVLLDRYPSELSGGQRQRVSLMRALMLDPDVLLLDEPLAALDPMVRSLLQTDLKRVFAELQKTVILVTHDLPEAAYFADTIILMGKGSIVQTGTLDEIQTAPKSEFVTSFIAAQRSLANV
jgi:osmoprotectant transport system ATP-binding protein